MEYIISNLWSALIFNSIYKVRIMDIVKLDLWFRSLRVIEYWIDIMKCGTSMRKIYAEKLVQNVMKFFQQVRVII